MRIQFIVPLIVVNILFFASCKKQKFSQAEITATTDIALVQGLSTDLQTLAEQAHTLDSSYMYASSACVKIKLDTSHTTSTQDLLIIDFGTSPCQCRDNKYRTGKLIITYSNGFTSTLSNLTISFDNYGVGLSSVALSKLTNSSTQTIINNRFNTNGFLSWSISSNLTINTSLGKTITFKDNLKRVQTTGNPLIFDGDNRFTITGSGSGTTSNDINFNCSVFTGKDLLKDFSCAKTFTQGIITVSSSALTADILIDFGDSSCTNNKATIQKSRSKQEITLE
ncbi:MAG: hypothetical protein RIQ33_1357 [Bacteroidota bacterium]|jgi:hypothetical protein